MSKLEQLRAQAQAAAATGVDMNEAVKGGQGARLLPAGYAFGRFIEYIELGKHPQEYQGTAKEPALEVQLGFALFNCADRVYQNEDGSPYIIRPFQFAVSRNEKAKAFKLFKAMNWKGTAKSFGELLGEVFLIKIVHVRKSQNDATIVSRIDFDGFLPPLDQATGQPYQIPQVDDNLYQLFLWDQPTKEAWDALYVEGKWDDGKSKNRIQETILSAIDFAGSPLQQLIMGGAVAVLPTTPETPVAAPAAGALPPGVGYAPAFSTPPAAAPAVVPAAIPPAEVATPLAQPAVAAAAPPISPVAAIGPASGIAVAPAVTPIVPTTSPSNPA